MRRNWFKLFGFFFEKWTSSHRIKPFSGSKCQRERKGETWWATNGIILAEKYHSRETNLSLAFIRKYQSWVCDSKGTLIYSAMCKIQSSIAQPLTSLVSKKTFDFCQPIQRNSDKSARRIRGEGTHTAFPPQWQYCAAVNIHRLFLLYRMESLTGKWNLSCKVSRESRGGLSKMTQRLRNTVTGEPVERQRERLRSVSFAGMAWISRSQARVTASEAGELGVEKVSAKV